MYQVVTCYSKIYQFTLRLGVSKLGYQSLQHFLCMVYQFGIKTIMGMCFIQQRTVILILPFWIMHMNSYTCLGIYMSKSRAWKALIKNQRAVISIQRLIWLSTRIKINLANPIVGIFSILFDNFCVYSFRLYPISFYIQSHYILAMWQVRDYNTQNISKFLVILLKKFLKYIFFFKKDI